MRRFFCLANPSGLIVLLLEQLKLNFLVYTHSQSKFQLIDLMIIHVLKSRLHSQRTLAHQEHL